jgi:hypothetical protein
MNISKKDWVGRRQLDTALKLHAAGFLSDAGLRAVFARGEEHGNAYRPTGG